MTASEQFLKFAAECESMANFSQERENKPVWHRLAERWVRCAELAEQQDVAAQEAQRKKRERQAKHHHSELAVEQLSPYWLDPAINKAG